MARIMIVGAGDIGGGLACHLHGQGHDVVAVRRSDKAVGDGITCVQADVADPETLIELAQPVDILVYSVASPDFSKEGYHTFYYKGLKTYCGRCERRHLSMCFLFLAPAFITRWTANGWMKAPPLSRAVLLAKKCWLPSRRC